MNFKNRIVKISQKILESYHGMVSAFYPTNHFNSKDCMTRSFIKGGSTYVEYIMLLGTSPVLIKGHAEENVCCTMSVHIS